VQLVPCVRRMMIISVCHLITHLIVKDLKDIAATEDVSRSSP